MKTIFKKIVSVVNEISNDSISDADVTNDDFLVGKQKFYEQEKSAKEFLETIGDSFKNT